MNWQSELEKFRHDIMQEIHQLMSTSQQETHTSVSSPTPFQFAKPPQTPQSVLPQIPSTDVVQLQSIMGQLQQEVAHLRAHRTASPVPSSTGTLCLPDGALDATTQGFQGFKPPSKASFHQPSEVDPTLQNLARSQQGHKEQGLEPELMALLAGQSGFQPPRPTSNTSGCAAQIMMLQGQPQPTTPQLSTGIFNPLMLAAQGPAPKLSQKYHGGWATFAKQWRHHTQMLSLGFNK